MPLPSLEPRGHLYHACRRHGHHSWRGVLLVAGLCLSASIARAQAPVVLGFEGAPGADGVPGDWTMHRWSPVLGFGDFEAKAEVRVRGATKTLCVRSRRAGFMVGTQRTLDVEKLPNVSWSWIAEALPVGGSFKARATNDQALQLLFAFTGGTVVGYIWDGSGNVGESGSGLSWQDDVRVIVVRGATAPLGEWHFERRNLMADYAQLFGGKPPPLKGVAVQSNANHTESLGAGCVGPIGLSP